jgi:hypothetical protein
MRIIIAAIACVTCLLAAPPARADEPIVGTWQMIYQKVAGERQRPLPLALKVVHSSKGLEFAYLWGREAEITMTFTARLDGTEAIVTDGKGAAMGIAKLNKTKSDYRLTLQQPDRRPEPGKLTISEQGRILTVESDGVVPGKGLTHIIQVFARQ